VREQLLNDLEVEKAILESARESGTPYEAVRRHVEEAIGEMVPKFSLGTYYKFGLVVARWALRIPYRPTIDRESFKRIEEIPREAVQVYVLNHRTNFDYVLASYALHRRIVLSWAVGEWARIWPLEQLFRAFGAFFVRRKSGDALYRTLLRRYVQLMTRQGVTQGFFPEGKLTRDGALAEARAGLLDYIVTARADPSFARDIVFVPVGLQFDRVFEDEVLISEAKGREHPPTWYEKLGSLAYIIASLPLSLAFNLFRLATGRLMGRFGIAAVSFGAPLSLDAWMKEHAPDLPRLSREERAARVAELLRALMARIGDAIPATPVPLTAHALVQAGALEGPVSIDAVAALAARAKSRLAQDGAPVILGKEFLRLESAKERLAEVAGRAVQEISGELIDLEEAEGAVRDGLVQLARRGAVTVKDERVRIIKRDLVLYYARSIPRLGPLAEPRPAAVPAVAAR
jgi:glycerol-3-phosphate O-acyltransferase